jgi:hypothetical protein
VVTSCSNKTNNDLLAVSLDLILEMFPNSQLDSNKRTEGAKKCHVSSSKCQKFKQISARMNQYSRSDLLKDVSVFVCFFGSP